ALLLGNPGPDRPIGRPASFELWDVDANRLVRRRPLSYGLLRTYVPNSHLLVLVAVDLPSQGSQQISHITLLDAENDTINATVDVVGQVENVAVSRDGFVFSAMSSDGHLSLWRTTEDHGKLTTLQSLEVKHAAMAGPEFGPASDTIAFAINNLL